MHEFSIASCAVDRIMATAQDKRAKRIREVEILVGELSLVGKEQFLFWMNEMLLSKGEITSNVKIIRGKYICQNICLRWASYVIGFLCRNAGDICSEDMPVF